MSDYPGGLGDGSGAYSEVIHGEKKMPEDVKPAPGEVEDVDVVGDEVEEDDDDEFDDKDDDVDPVDE